MLPDAPSKLARAGYVEYDFLTWCRFFVEAYTDDSYVVVFESVWFAVFAKGLLDPLSEGPGTLRLVNHHGAIGRYRYFGCNEAVAFVHVLDRVAHHCCISLERHSDRRAVYIDSYF